VCGIIDFRIPNKEAKGLGPADVVTLYASSRYYWHQLDREKGEPGYPNVADCRLQALNRAAAKLPPLPNDIATKRSPKWDIVTSNLFKFFTSDNHIANMAREATWI
jgi:hypothetical protein